MRSIVVFFVLLGLSMIVAQTTFNACNSEAYPFEITSLTVNPDPIVIGQNVNLTVSGTLTGVTITGGNSVLQVNWCPSPGDCTPLPPFFFSNCDLGTVLTCPIAPGSQTISQAISVPSFASAGVYSGYLQVNNTDNSILACVDFSTQLVSSS